MSKHALEMEIDCAAAAAAVDAMPSESIPFPVQEAKANKDSVKDHVQTHTHTRTHRHTYITHTPYTTYTTIFISFISFHTFFASFLLLLLLFLLFGDYFLVASTQTFTALALALLGLLHGQNEATKLGTTCVQWQQNEASIVQAQRDSGLA